MAARDNRNYVWRADEVSQRPEYPLIEAWVPENARVIDLGCGDGSLLKRLADSRGAQGYGIELAPSGVAACRAKGIQADEGAIDVPLEAVADDAFDVAVCNVTLQMVMRPEVLLREMRRVAPRQIVSFPNFAYVPNRVELLFRGRMPRRMLFGYQWYSTGHIHQLSIADFRETCAAVGLTVRDAHYLGSAGPLTRWMPNLMAYEGVFLLERAPG